MKADAAPSRAALCLAFAAFTIAPVARADGHDATDFDLRSRKMNVTLATVRVRHAAGRELLLRAISRGLIKSLTASDARTCIR